MVHEACLALKILKNMTVVTDQKQKEQRDQCVEILSDLIKKVDEE